PIRFAPWNRGHWGAPTRPRRERGTAAAMWRLLPGGSPDNGRLLPLAIFNGATVEFVQLNDSCPAAHQRRYRQPSLGFIFRLNDGPSAVDAGFASPVKIPEIALCVEHLDQIKAFLPCVRRLDQVAIHVSLLSQKTDAASFSYLENPSSATRQKVPTGT